MTSYKRTKRSPRRPAIADPAASLVRAALDGRGGTPEKINALLERTAIARLVEQERRSLRQLVDPAVIKEFHRRLETGCADEILDELRGGGWDESVVTLDEAMQTLGTIPSDPAQFVNTASAAQLAAWQALKPAAETLDRIALIAVQFGPRGAFPMIRNPKERDVGLEIGWLHDCAVMCCADDLRASSYAFQKPAPPADVASSPWLHVRPHLHTIAEAAERLRVYVENDWDTRESQRGDAGYFDANNVLVKDVRRNPHSLAKR